MLDGYSWWRSSVGGWMVADNLAEAVRIPAPSARSPVQTVTTFYTYIAARRYAHAYQLMSQDLRQRQRYESWVADYATTEAVVIERVQPTSSISTVEASMLATDRFPTGNVNRRFAGPVELVQEEGEWRINAARLRVVP